MEPLSLIRPPPQGHWGSKKAPPGPLGLAKRLFSLIRCPRVSKWNHFRSSGPHLEATGARKRLLRGHWGSQNALFVNRVPSSLQMEPLSLIRPPPQGHWGSKRAPPGPLGLAKRLFSLIRCPRVSKWSHFRSSGPHLKATGARKRLLRGHWGSQKNSFR